MSDGRPLVRDNPGGAGWAVVVDRQPASTSTSPKHRPAGIVGGQQFGRPQRRAGPENRLVTHAHAALAFFTGGSSRLELNGEWRLRAGDVLLVPPGAPHRLLERQQAAAWRLGFCVPCFAAAGATSLLAPFERVRDGASAVVHIPKARRAYLESLARLAKFATFSSDVPAPRAKLQTRSTRQAGAAARAA